MNKKLNKNAVIYTRVSSVEQAECGFSLARQEEECKEFALREGYNVSKIFIEKGESAKATGKVTIIKRETIKENNGQYYDHINKQTIQKYKYSTKETEINSFDFEFIIVEKLSILPPICSAIAIPASLPELNINPYNNSDIFILSPTFKSTLEPPI